MLKNGKKVLVFGSGKSGIGAVMLLEHEGVDTILYDGNENSIRKKSGDVCQRTVRRK